MAKKKGTAGRRGNLSDAKIKKVFQKGKPGPKGSKVRKDACGDSIRMDKHGKKGKEAWEGDHIKPVSKGGSNKLSNLRPLKTSTNRKRGNKKLSCGKGMKKS